MVIQQVQPELQPFITVKMLQLTMSEGFSDWLCLFLCADFQDGRS
jgi:hypothetical protein